MKRALVVVGLCIAAPVHAQDDESPPDTLVAPPATGPAADVDAICTTVPLAEVQDPDYPRDCTLTKLKPKLKAKTPYQDFRLVERSNDSATDMYLAIRTGDQWYLALLAGWSNDGPSSGDLTIKKTQIKDVIPGGAPEILLTGTYSHHTEDDLYNYYGSDFDALWVCSVGASGAPSCVEVPTGQNAHPHPDNGIKPWKFKLAVKFEKDGRITRKLKGKWPKRPEWSGGDPLDKADYVNTRTLSFP